jgi:hypothetical protein
MLRNTELLEAKTQVNNSRLGKSCDCRESRVRTVFTLVAKLEGLGLRRIWDRP